MCHFGRPICCETETISNQFPSHTAC
jgi:hypothetical protein